MKKIDSALLSFLLWSMAFLLFCMMAIIFTQVVARYIFNYSLSWSEEVGRYLFIWISFLGLAAAFKSGSHIALDYLLKKLRGVPYLILWTVNSLLTVGFSLAVVVSGVKLLRLGMRQQSPALDLPMYLVYVVVPLSGLLLLYYSIRQLMTYARPEPDGKEC